MSATYKQLSPRKATETLASALLEQQRRRAGTEHLDLLSWTMLRRPRLMEGKPFDLSQHPYLAELYRERARAVVVNKASQMGASEYAISYALHAADERMATPLYVFPTDTHVSDFSAARIGPAIEASDYLGGIIVESRAGEQRGADRVTLKRVRNRFLYLRGGQVSPKGLAPQLKSIDADVLILDEVDEMDPRAPSIAVKRLGHSLLAEERWISTPTYARRGIHEKWMESDQREWMVRCGGCGEWQGLTISMAVTEWDELGRPRAWHQDGNGAYLACWKCGKRLERLGQGRWVATFPGRDMAGFHLTKLFSAQSNLDAIIINLQTTDETKRKEAFNQDLGEPYRPRGGQISEETLEACKREYGPGPVKGERTAMGVDIGKTIHIVVRGRPDLETGERPLRFAGEVESFERLHAVIQEYDAQAVVIDALPETRKARELQERFPSGRVWLAYYVGQKTGSHRAELAQWKEAEGTVDLDRTRSLDQMYARFMEKTNTLPANGRDIPSYYRQLMAPVRTLEEGPGGQQVAVYIESEADHYAHAENYCAVASGRETLPGGVVQERTTERERPRSAWRGR